MFMRRPHEHQPRVPDQRRGAPPLALRATPSGTGSAPRLWSACCYLPRHVIPIMAGFLLTTRECRHWPPLGASPACIELAVYDDEHVNNNNKKVSNGNQDLTRRAPQFCHCPCFCLPVLEQFPILIPAHCRLLTAHCLSGPKYFIVTTSGIAPVFCETFSAPRPLTV